MERHDLVEVLNFAAIFLIVFSPPYNIRPLHLSLPACIVLSPNVVVITFLLTSGIGFLDSYKLFRLATEPPFYGHSHHYQIHFPSRHTFTANPC